MMVESRAGFVTGAHRCCGVLCAWAVVLGATACSTGGAGRDGGDVGVSAGTTGGDTSGDPQDTVADADGDSSATADDTSTAPLADDAEVVSFEYAPVMACGQWGWAQLVMRNTGTNTWTAEAGYALVPTAAPDPFGGTDVALPELIEVPQGGTWLFDIELHAPETDGDHPLSWQLARAGSGFGATATGGVTVDCSAPLPDLPDHYYIVEQVAAEQAHLLEENTFESCGELVQHVLVALSAVDPEWGHVAKTAGEYQHTPPNFVPHDVNGHFITGFSHDAIFHRASYWQVDIIANAGANSDPDPAIHGPASITWQVIPQKYYRENNPWIPTVPP
jgi:hypothetical protein